MAQYLIDTNLLVRTADQTSPLQSQDANAVGNLTAEGNDVYLTSQNFIEFWAVATRPTTANGLGWTVPYTDRYIQQLRDTFLFLPDTPDVFTYWRRLVLTYNITSKRAHDTRLVAVMLTHGVTHLLTFNTDDFKAFSNITLVHPDEVA